MIFVNCLTRHKPEPKSNEKEIIKGFMVPEPANAQVNQVKIHKQQPDRNLLITFTAF
jgi:hypothetical protein